MSRLMEQIVYMCIARRLGMDREFRRQGIGDKQG